MADSLGPTKSWLRLILARRLPCRAPEAEARLHDRDRHRRFRHTSEASQCENSNSLTLSAKTCVLTDPSKESVSDAS